jgi:hypothetical protein
MKNVVIELLNHLGLGRGAYIDSLHLYCRRLNEYTNNKFDFRPRKDEPNIVTFRQGVMVHLLKLNFAPKWGDKGETVESIEIVENDHLLGQGDDGEL